MNSIVRFFHELRHPHCPHCINDSINPVVEELKIQLESLKYERDRLLKYILDDKPNQYNQYNTNEANGLNIKEEPEPILPKIVPWHVRRQMLEDEDRKKASLIRQNKEQQLEAVAEMEKNLGIVQDKVLNLGDDNVQSKSVKINE